MRFVVIVGVVLETYVTLATGGGLQLRNESELTVYPMKEVNRLACERDKDDDHILDSSVVIWNHFSH